MRIASHRLHHTSIRLTGRGPGEVQITIAGGKPVVFRVLCTIAFTSTRKRMSVIVKTPDGKILLMTKGADNIVGGRSKAFMDSNKEDVDHHLRLFSEDGLRTLMLAIKEVRGTCLLSKEERVKADV